MDIRFTEIQKQKIKLATSCHPARYLKNIIGKAKGYKAESCINVYVYAENFKTVYKSNKNFFASCVLLEIYDINSLLFFINNKIPLYFCIGNIKKEIKNITEIDYRNKLSCVIHNKNGIEGIIFNYLVFSLLKKSFSLNDYREIPINKIKLLFADKPVRKKYARKYITPEEMDLHEFFILVPIFIEIFNRQKNKKLRVITHDKRVIHAASMFGIAKYFRYLDIENVKFLFYPENMRNKIFSNFTTISFTDDFNISELKKISLSYIEYISNRFEKLACGYNLNDSIKAARRKLPEKYIPQLHKNTINRKYSIVFQRIQGGMFHKEWGIEKFKRLSDMLGENFELINISEDEMYTDLYSRDCGKENISAKIEELVSCDLFVGIDDWALQYCGLAGIPNISLFLYNTEFLKETCAQFIPLTMNISIFPNSKHEITPNFLYDIIVNISEKKFITDEKFINLSERIEGIHFFKMTEDF